MSPLDSYLDSYCLDQHWLEVFEHFSGLGVLARVTRVDRGECDVVTEVGPARVSAPISDVCTGDWVVVSADHVVVQVLPRRTALVRSSAGSRSDGQVLAGNVDTVVIAVAGDTELDLGRVERYVALAWESGAVPVIALTKVDRCENAPAVTESLTRAAPGVDVHAVSAVTAAGLGALTGALRGTIALIGPSGAGKSTLGNALIGTSAFGAGAVRTADSKGKHTTVHRELIPFPAVNGALLDTPGLRAIGLQNAETGVHQTFSDIETLAEHCRFNDCAHTTEPGCAVLDAIDAGTLDRRRLNSYRKLLRENAWATSRHDARLRSEKLSEYKRITKQLRQTGPARGRR